MVSQTYVQDLMLKEAKMIYELIAIEKGHFYVCGDCKMAENVYQTLKSIIQEQSGMNSTQSDNFMLGLRVRTQHYFRDLRDWRPRKLEVFFFSFCGIRGETCQEFRCWYLLLNYLEEYRGEDSDGTRYRDDVRG